MTRTQELYPMDLRDGIRALAWIDPFILTCYLWPNSSMISMMLFLSISR